MLASEVVTNIQNTLQTSGVYRSSAFVLKGVNEALKLTAYLTLYDERRVSGSTTGTRNIVELPKASDDAEMVFPIYASNGVSGNRINPVRILDMEFDSNDWEGTISGADATEYIVFSPAGYLESEFLAKPIQNTGTMQYDFIGAFIPVDLSSSDEIDFPEQYAECLYYYGLFFCYISMPGKVQECVDSYGNYVDLANQLARDRASRFPSSQGVKPVPVEFSKDTINIYDIREGSSDEKRVTQ